VGIRHRGIVFTGRVGASLTEIDQLLLEGTYLGAHYFDNSGRYTNYRVVGVTPTYKHGFDPLNAGLLMIRSNRFSTTSGPAATVDTVTPMLGWAANPVQTLNITATVGFQQTMSKSPAILGGSTDKSSHDIVFGLEAIYKGEQDFLRFNFAQTPSPQSTGQQLQTTSFTITGRHNLTPTFEADLNALYQITDYSNSSGASGSTTDNEETSYVSLSPSLIYHMLEDIDLNLTYRYRRQVNLRQETAQSNAFLLTVSFAPAQVTLKW